MAHNAYLHIITLKKQDIFQQWIDFIGKKYLKLI